MAASQVPSLPVFIPKLLIKNAGVHCKPPYEKKYMTEYAYKRWRKVGLRHRVTKTFLNEGCCVRGTSSFIFSRRGSFRVTHASTARGSPGTPINMNINRHP